MVKILKFVKKNSLPLFLIAIGIAIFIATSNWMEVPSGIGPAFFPKLVAAMLIGFSVIVIILGLKKENVGEFTPTKEATKKMIITCVAILGLVAIMKYVHPMVGIALFIFGYIKVIAGLSWKKTIIITILGVLLMYVTIIGLRIPF